jgi:electron transfer flavoprotein alpha/beta subunit
LYGSRERLNRIPEESRQGRVGHGRVIGPAKAEETLRIAFATGADCAILVEAGDQVTPLAVAKILKGPLTPSC